MLTLFMDQNRQKEAFQLLMQDSHLEIVIFCGVCYMTNKTFCPVAKEQLLFAWRAKTVKQNFASRYTAMCLNLRFLMFE